MSVSEPLLVAVFSPFAASKTSGVGVDGRVED